MIHLDDDKDYFILIDGQGASFGGGRIFEGIEEVADQFIEWADSDEMELAENKQMPDNIGGCLPLWVMDLQKYNGREWNSVENYQSKEDKKILDYIK